MTKYSKNKIIDEFMKRGDEIEKSLSKAANSKRIKRILEKHDKNPNHIEEIYWKLMACGVGEQVALSIINKSRFLKKYLKMMSEGMSDIEVAKVMMELLNK